MQRRIKQFSLCVLNVIAIPSNQQQQQQDFRNIIIFHYHHIPCHQKTHSSSRQPHLFYCGADFTLETNYTPSLPVNGTNASGNEVTRTKTNYRLRVTNDVEKIVDLLKREERKRPTAVTTRVVLEKTLTQSQTTPRFIIIQKTDVIQQSNCCWHLVYSYSLSSVPIPCTNDVMERQQAVQTAKVLLLPAAFELELV